MKVSLLAQNLQHQTLYQKDNDKGSAQTQAMCDLCILTIPSTQSYQKDVSNTIHSKQNKKHSLQTFHTTPHQNKIITQEGDNAHLYPID